MTESSPEPILWPDLPIVDCHHHLWDRSMLVSSLPPVIHPFERIVRMVPRYLLDELLKDVRLGHNVTTTVFVECRSMYRANGPAAMQPLGEVEFVNGVAAMSASNTYGEIRACAGIVGHADLMLGDRAAAVLETQIALTSRFKGIRHSAAYDRVLGPLAGRPAGLLMDTSFRKGFACLAPLGLSFDAWLLEPQLSDLIDLARAFPDTSIILDHVGTPLGIAAYAGRRHERFGAWQTSIRELARAENVTVKLGGLAMPFAGFDVGEAQSSEQLAGLWKPYIDTCIEAFGPDRCMFESNFPVDLYTCGYAVLWNALKRTVPGASEAEKTALFSGTATRVYRL
jgi:L-fuconolactonase